MQIRKYRKPSAARLAAPPPAPGELEIVEAFLNTALPRGGADELASPEGVAEWLIRRRLLAAGTELGEDDRQRAIAVRRVLRRLLAAPEATADAEALRRLADATDGARFRLRFDDGGPAGVDPVSQSFDDALGALLTIVVAARLEGRWRKLKLCASDDCRRAFFDSSQNGDAKYCTRRCGGRERMRAYRRRR